jgi:tetratricopeptide (TPR) repeat protein
MIARLSVVILLVAAAPAVAQNDEEPGGNAEARRKFRDGNALYAAGQYAQAAEAFKAGIAADPSLVGLYRNLGLALRAQGQWADALKNYERYLELKPESAHTERVKREIALCREKLGLKPAGVLPVEARLHIAAEGAHILVDGTARGLAPLDVAVAPGRHFVRAERPGYVAAEQSLDAAAGAELTVALTLLPAPAIEARAAPATPPPPRTLRRAAWAMIGVAGGAALFGGAFGIAESSVHRDAVAPPPTATRADIDALTSRGQAFGAVAWTGLAVGAAALVTAVGLFAAEPQRSETHAPLRYLTGELAAW